MEQADSLRPWCGDSIRKLHEDALRGLESSQRHVKVKSKELMGNTLLFVRYSRSCDHWLDPRGGTAGDELVTFVFVQDLGFGFLFPLLSSGLRKLVTEFAGYNNTSMKYFQQCKKPLCCRLALQYHEIKERQRCCGLDASQTGSSLELIRFQHLTTHLQIHLNKSPPGIVIAIWPVQLTGFRTKPEPLTTFFSSIYT